jgi:hypothetical protein
MGVHGIPPKSNNLGVCPPKFLTFFIVKTYWVFHRGTLGEGNTPKKAKIGVHGVPQKSFNFGVFPPKFLTFFIVKTFLVFHRGTFGEGNTPKKGKNWGTWCTSKIV